jgi:hypothetical protein
VSGSEEFPCCETRTGQQRDPGRHDVQLTDICERLSLLDGIHRELQDIYLQLNTLKYPVDDDEEYGAALS